MKILKTKPAFIPMPPKKVALHAVLIYENDKYLIEVFTGYISNGGSIPRLVWTLLGITPLDPRCVYAFILHDFLYETHLIPRADADLILDEVLDIPPACNALQRWLIYVHVRLYGWLPYRRTAEQIEAGRWFGKVTRKPV